MKPNIFIANVRGRQLSPKRAKLFALAALLSLASSLCFLAVKHLPMFFLFGGIAFLYYALSRRN